MAGLISNVIDPTPKTVDVNGATVGQAGVTGYDPAQVTINPEKQTVSGQLKSILSQGNPYIERAQSGAMDYANSRGLVNSTMAAQAGQAAAIDAALPIANADAGIYNTAELANVGEKNKASQFGAGAANTASLTNAGAVSDIGKLQEQGTQQRESLAQSGQQDVALQTLKGTQAKSLADTEAQYKTLIQSSATAGELFKSTQATMTSILNNPDSSPEAKQSAVAALTQILQGGLSVAGAIADLDLSALLQPA